jgi:hypothetical protein
VLSSSVMLVLKAGKELMRDSSLRLRWSLATHSVASCITCSTANIPIKFFFPVLLRIYNPFSAHAKPAVTSIVLQIFIRLFRNGAKP